MTNRRTDDLISETFETNDFHGTDTKKIDYELKN